MEGRTNRMPELNQSPPSSPTSQLQWQLSTNRLVDNAVYSHHLSAKERTRAFDMQNSTDKSLSAVHSASCAALQDQIHQSETLMKRAILESREIQHEESLVVAAIDAAMATIELLHDPLGIAEQALALRSRRPQSECTKDNAERALREQISGCSHLIRSLSTQCETGKREAAKLHVCLQNLEGDIQAKLQSIKLDKEALDLQFSHYAEHSNLQRQRPAGHPMQWKMHTEKLVHEGGSTRGSAQRFRDRARMLMQEASEVQRRTTEASIHALRNKADEITKLKTCLTTTLDQCCEELETLYRAMDAVSRTDQGLQHPISVAQSRLAMRTVKPDQELVLDHAELSLEKEISDLSRSRTKLQMQHSRQSEDFNNLERQRHRMELDIKAKKLALQCDEECLVQLTALRSRTAKSTPPAPASSGRLSPTMKI